VVLAGGLPLRDEAQDGGDQAVLTAERRAAAGHLEERGQPITRARLGVSNRAVCELLPQLRVVHASRREGAPPDVGRSAPAGAPGRAGDSSTGTVKT
jgi:hypothetical protein